MRGKAWAPTALIQQGSAQSADGSGEFIVRCFYVAPWIPYMAWQNYPGLIQRPSNDFSYTGPFGDIVEDCVQGSGTPCQPEFITDTQPDEVYGTTANNNP